MATKSWNDSVDLGRGIASITNFETTPPVPVYSALIRRPFHQTAGGSVQNYREKIKRVQSAVGEYTATHNSVMYQQGSGRCLIKNAGNPTTYSRTVVNGRICDSVTAGAHGMDVSDADLLARTAFWSSVNAERHRLMSGVVFGELAKTLAMIRNPAKALFRKVVDSSAGRKKRLARERGPRRNRVASELWLESSFGWRPLIADVRNGAEALAELSFMKPTRYISKGGKANDVVSEATNIRNLGFFRAVTTNRVVNEVTVRYTGVVQLDTGSVSRRQRGLFGLDWNSVLPTVWELMPFSFLTDYFTNVGEVISSHSYGGVPIRWACKSTVKRQIATSTVGNYFTTASGDDVEVYSYLNPGSVESIWAQFNRVQVYGVEFPTLSFSLPHGLQWLNLAALGRACSFTTT